MEELVEWLKQIAVFMILCETILSFAPTKNYKRYIKPFVGMILLFRISAFLFGAAQVDWSERIGEVFIDYEKSVSQYLEGSTVIDEDMKGKIFKEDLINIDKVVIDQIQIGGEE